MSATAGVDAGTCTTLGANNDINQLCATVSAGTGSGTALGANHGINQISAATGSTLGSKRSRFSLSN